MARSTVHAVILNPGCAGGRGAARWRGILASAAGRAHGLHEARVHDGSVDGVRDFLRARFSEGARHFVVAGGDGTLNGVVGAWLAESAAGRMDSTVARLGAIGIGSSNDFHKPFDRSGRLRVAGHPARLNFGGAFAHDLGWVSLDGGASGSFPFAVNASVGVTAEANARFNAGSGPLAALKRASTDMASVYAALSTFVSYRNRRLLLSEEGGAERELELTNLGIIKNRHFSGSFRYDFGPEPADGRLGLLSCEGMSRSRMLSTLVALGRGRFQGLPGTGASFTERVRLSSADGKAFAVETDGEVRMAREAEFRILPRSIVLCP